MIKVEIERPGHFGPKGDNPDGSILASEVHLESAVAVSPTLQLNFSLCPVVLFPERPHPPFHTQVSILRA